MLEFSGWKNLQKIEIRRIKMKYIVTYSSKYGSTKKYAQWIAEELSCDMEEIKKIDVKTLRTYDVVIHGGGLYAGGLSGIKRLIKLYPSISDKKVIVFSCGLANPESQKNIEHIEHALSKVIPPEMYQSILQFHFRGGIDYSKLGFVHKAMMWMLCRTMRKKGYDHLNAEDKLMLDTYGKQIDFSDKTTITPLINCAKQNSQLES